MRGNSQLIKDCNAFLPDQGFCTGIGILMNKGRIETVGKDIRAPSDTEIHDASGAWATSGLIDGHTHLGMKESAYNESDVNEKSDPVTPYAQAIDAINPFNEVFSKALSNGVTTVMVLPGSTNVFGGLGALIKTYGSVIDHMVLKAPAAMKMALGYNPKNAHGGNSGSPATRMGAAYIARKVFTQALEYRERRKRKADDRPAKDIGLENVLSVLSGDLPARIHCHRADDIMTAVRIADEFKFDFCLDHATEGHMVAGELAARDIPCFIGPSLLSARKQENTRKGFSNAEKLRRAGIRFAIVSDHDVEPCWYLAVFAGLAVREGLSEDYAMEAVTCRPAEIMGVQDRVGRLAEGADADVVLWDRHPLFMGKPLKVFASGNTVDKQPVI